MTRTFQFLHLEEKREDAERLRETLAREYLPAEVTWVCDREALLAALQAGWVYDLVFAEVALPGFEGDEALTLVRQACPHLPFIIVSGALGEERAVECLRRGATDYVLKTNLARLAPVTRRALEEAREARGRREAEASSLRMATLLRAVLEATTEGVLVADLAGRVSAYNRKFLTLCGIPDFVMAPMKVEVVLRFLMDQFQDPAAFLAEALHPKTPPEKGIEGILTSAGGRDLEARLMATRVKDAPGGQVLRVREASPPVPGDGGHAGDEALLRAAARHLAAPVEKLANRLELLAATHPLNEAQRRHLAAACEALECLQALLDQFRGPAPGNVREVELNALLESLRPRSEALLPEGARLRLKPAAGPLPLAVDPAHVEHVVQALITNAGEASPSTLTLRTGSLPGAARSEGKVFLELEDDGHGLAAGVRAQLFRPFFTTRPGRPGLGLWRARSLLALYGGTLTAEPVVPRGTRFRAEWPALP